MGTAGVGRGWIWGSQLSLSHSHPQHRAPTPQPHSPPVPQFPLWVGLGGVSPAVGDSAAVAPHPQALLQVGGEAGGGDAAAAVGADTLLVLPLVVHLPEDVHPRLVHDLCGSRRVEGGMGGQRNQPSPTSHPGDLSLSSPPPFPPHRSPSCCRGRCHPGRSSRI